VEAELLREELEPPHIRFQKPEFELEERSLVKVLAAVLDPILLVVIFGVTSVPVRLLTLDSEAASLLPQEDPREVSSDPDLVREEGIGSTGLEESLAVLRPAVPEEASQEEVVRSLVEAPVEVAVRDRVTFPLLPLPREGMLLTTPDEMLRSLAAVSLRVEIRFPLPGLLSEDPRVLLRLAERLPVGSEVPGAVDPVLATGVPAVRVAAAREVAMAVRVLREMPSGSPALKPLLTVEETLVTMAASTRRLAKSVALTTVIPLPL